MGFYIAPEAGTFNNINYQAGFWMYGGIVMFNEVINLDIVVKILNCLFLLRAIFRSRLQTLSFI